MRNNHTDQEAQAGDQTKEVVHPEVEKPQGHHNKSTWHTYGWFIIFFIAEMIIILLYGLFTAPSIEVSPLTADIQNAKSQEVVKQYYPAYQDIHVMMLVGFGFLYTYLHRFSWSSMSQNFILMVYCIQIGILNNGFFEMIVSQHFDKAILIDIKTLITADFSAAAILISLGGMLGKLNFGQCLVMATLEIIFYSPNLALGERYFHAIDLGGSMFIHTFGAYFGIACSIVYHWNNEEVVKDHEHNRSGYGSNLFGYIGTAFLWLFWPSFNGALATGNAQHRVIVNTVFSLTGSALSVFLITPLLNHGKYKMECLLNATLAGGVAVGAACDVLAAPWAAILIGFIAGTISLLGFEYLSSILQKKIRLYDTAGIHNLHGMPGVFGSIVGIIMAAQSSADLLGPSLKAIYPEMENGRTPMQQAQMQASALASSLLFGIVGGIITGFILRIQCCFDGPDTVDYMFSDLIYFEELEEADNLVHEEPQAEEHINNTEQAVEMKLHNGENRNIDIDIIDVENNNYNTHLRTSSKVLLPHNKTSSQPTGSLQVKALRVESKDFNNENQQ